MLTNSQTIITNATDKQRESVIALLQTEKLPVEDLPASMQNFFVAQLNDVIVGAIGLEQCGNYALLRSMVVSKEYRNNNIASRLVERLEQHGSSLGIHIMFLLTETVPVYFEKKGYQQISREEVPPAVQTSSEFSHVCPVSAIVMKKQLSYT